MSRSIFCEYLKKEAPGLDFQQPDLRAGVGNERGRRLTLKQQICADLSTS